MLIRICIVELGCHSTAVHIGPFAVFINVLVITLGDPVIVVCTNSRSNAVIHEGVGDCPVTAAVFTGNEFGIDQAFVIPCFQHFQGFLIALGGGRINKFRRAVMIVVKILESRMVSTAVRSAWVHTKGAEHIAHAVGTDAIGVLHAVTVRIFVGELVEKVMQFIQGLGRLFNPDLLHPGLVIYNREMEEVAGGQSGKTILHTIHRTIGQEQTVLVIHHAVVIDGEIFLHQFHVEGADRFLVNIGVELGRILQADYVGRVVCDDVGVQHFEEVAVFNIRHFNIHIEGVFDQLDRIGIFSCGCNKVLGPQVVILRELAVILLHIRALHSKSGSSAQGQGQHQNQCQNLFHIRASLKIIFPAEMAFCCESDGMCAQVSPSGNRP